MTIDRSEDRGAALRTSIRAVTRRHRLLGRCARAVRPAHRGAHLAAGVGARDLVPQRCRRRDPARVDPGLGASSALHDPLHLFDANIFYPERYTLAYSIRC